MKEEDLKRCLAWINSPFIIKNLMRPGPVSMSQHKQWYESIKKDKSQKIFAIEILPEGGYIGNCGLRNIDKKARKTKLWLYIGDENKMGLGYGKMCVKALTKYAFSKLGLNKVCLCALSSNKRALDLYKKLNFIKEGTLKNNFFHEGKFYDVILLAAFKKDLKNHEA